MKKYYTQDDRPEPDDEVNSGELIVETAGYIPVEQQIETLDLAGRRLEAFKRGRYEFDPDEEVPEDAVGVTKYTDPLEAEAFLSGFRARVNDAKRKAEDAKRARKEKEDAETAELVAAGKAAKAASAEKDKPGAV